MSGYGFKRYFFFFNLKIYFTSTNSLDPDEMQHCAAFHLGLHCLQKYLFRGLQNTKSLERIGKNINYKIRIKQ